MIFNQIKMGDIQSIRDWVDAGNDINTIDSNQNSLLGFAILNQQWEVAQFLLERRASTGCVINNDPEHGSNVCLIRRPMQNHQWELVEQLIRCGANAGDCWNHLSPLGYFTQTNNTGMVKFILEKFPSLFDYPETHSPLKLAIISGNLEIVKILIPYNPSLTRKQSLSGDGVSAVYMATPIQFAQHYNRNDIVDYLIKYDSSLANHLSQTLHLDLADLDPESASRELMTVLAQDQSKSAELRREKAQMCFNDLKGLSSAVIQQVLPAIVIVNNGHIGTAFYQCPTWLVTNAHVAPSRDELEGWRLSSWSNEITSPAIKRSFHRQEREDMPDLVIIEIEDASHNSHPTLETKYSDNEGLDEVHTFYIDHDSEIKFLRKISDENSYPIMYECLDGSSPQPGTSGSPILEARVVISREPSWEFKVVGALYARCPPADQKESAIASVNSYLEKSSGKPIMLVCAIPVLQDFTQLVNHLNGLDEAERYKALGKASESFSDIKGQEAKKQYSKLVDIKLQQANVDLSNYEKGTPPLSINLPDGLEKLLGDGIVTLSQSVLLGEKVLNEWRAKKAIRQPNKRLLREGKKFPDIKLVELQENLSRLLDEINQIDEVNISKSNSNKTIFSSLHFRIDQLGASNHRWRLELQDNTDKYYIRTSPSLSSTFALVLFPKALEKLSGTRLSLAFKESLNDKIEKSYKETTFPLSSQNKPKENERLKAKSPYRSSLFGKSAATDIGEQFIQLLEDEFDVYVERVDQNGHCQFRAVANELHRHGLCTDKGASDLTDSIRKNLISFMGKEKPKQRLSPFFDPEECNDCIDYDDYLTQMIAASDSTKWTNQFGSHLTLTALGMYFEKRKKEPVSGDAYNRAIILLHPDDFVGNSAPDFRTRIFGWSDDLENLDFDKAIFLVYDGRNHYDSIWKISNSLKAHLKEKIKATIDNQALGFKF